jgi:hypothetical protein
MEALNTSSGAFSPSWCASIPGRIVRAAIESITARLSGSIRAALPQADTRNLVRLRRVPWMIVALVSVLAFATLVHALGESSVPTPASTSPC